MYFCKITENTLIFIYKYFIMKQDKIKIYNQYIDQTISIISDSPYFENVFQETEKYGINLHM